MEKSVYNMKAEKIQRQVKQGDYETAAKICDGIDWSQIRSVRMLSLVSSVYEHVGQYEKAIDILMQAYEEAPVGRRFLYKLTELALAAGNIKEAEEYYKNYLQEAPDDNQRYILRYEIAEAKGEPLDKRITILEAFKHNEFDEKWSCRLAELYDMLGNGERCVKICDEIILWFGVGPYVDRALELKERYQPLTAAQLDHRDNKAYYEDNLRKVQQQSRSGMFSQRNDEAALSSVTDGSTQKDEALPKVALSGPEMGVPITSFDPSAFAPEENEQYEPQDSMLDHTRKIEGLEDLSKTRIFEKIPDGTEKQLFKTVIASETDAPAFEAQEQMPYQPIASTVPDDGEQLSFSFAMEDEKGEPLPGIALASDEEPEKYFDTLCYVGADSPEDATKQAVALIENGHRIMRSDLRGISRISAVKLNQRGLISSLEALAGRDIIVLGASVLSDAIITEIKKVNSGLERGKIIVLADSPAGIIEIKDRINASQEDTDFETIYAGSDEETEKEYEAPEFSLTQEIPAEDGDDEEREPEAEITITSEPEIIKTSEPEIVIAPEPVSTEPAAETEPEFDFSMDEIESRPALHSSLDEADASFACIPDPIGEDAPEPVRPEPAPRNHSEDTGVSPEEFVKLIYAYMKKIDCVPEEGGEEDMLDYAQMLAERGEYLDDALAEEVTEEAADNAESHSLGNMFHSRYDKDGCLILRAKHFS